MPIFGWKGQGHQTSKTWKNCHLFVVRDCLLTGGESSAGGPGADCKLGLTVVRSNLLSLPKMLGNWTDGRISCRHSAPTSCFGYVYAKSRHINLYCCQIWMSKPEASSLFGLSVEQHSTWWLSALKTGQDRQDAVVYTPLPVDCYSASRESWYSWLGEAWMVEEETDSVRSRGAMADTLSTDRRYPVVELRDDVRSRCWPDDDDDDDDVLGTPCRMFFNWCDICMYTHTHNVQIKWWEIAAELVVRPWLHVK